MIGLSILIADFVLTETTEIGVGLQFVMIVIGGLFAILGPLLFYLALEEKENKK